MKEKSFERKTQLLQSALDEFSSHKYDDASLNSIIKNASISKGTFYYHFKNKQDLYLYLIEHSSHVKWEFIHHRTRDLNESFQKMDIFERFKCQARIGVEFAMEHPKYHKLAKMLVKEKGNEIFDIIKERLEIGTNKLHDMINEGIEKGDFKPNFPKDFILKTISFMFTYFDDIFYADGVMVLEETLENLDNYVDFMKHGLGTS
ncbi:TetR/AcrR family transcriptional regulator [Vallitalea pronyensis]|uniref:TetR/AcrR family transcriptional regulator n=1 Tax=Vallitalea pronyensis TaxID=1348613 RepID=A0A8J8SHZ2_9FIRM|nr:TetR/AcrR family transcriptional regulator [Vallitalea pronyensis]QUI24370.1 TetR/AcrR family transcriptional regulator [Vallitalea pronyensis]